MPIRHEPDPLRKVAMGVICEHFERLCYGASPDKVAAMVETDEYLKVEGPFVDMPGSLLAELAEGVSKRRALHRKHLHMLVQPQLPRLNLSFGDADGFHGIVFVVQRCKCVCTVAPLLVEEVSEELKHVTHLRRQHLHQLTTPRLSCWSLHGVADQVAAFEFLAHRCKSLKHLNLSYLRHVSPNVLMTLVPCFSSLVSLNLRMTLAVDQVLSQIGLHCPNLRELNLSGTPVSDRGLVQLCLSTEGRRQCQRLQKLVVSDTCITVSGAVVAVQALPSLTEFDYENIFEVLFLVERWDRALEARLLTPAGVRLSEQPVSPPSVLQLRSLVSSVEFVSMNALDAAVRLCPFATSLSIAGSWLPSEALYKFMVLEGLTALSLTNGEGLTMDFQEGVLPLLVSCGEKLQNLILTNFPEVDIASIGRVCPRLQNLALSAVGSFDPLGTVNPEWFSQLQALELWSEPSNDLSPAVIRQLLGSPQLRNLLFKGCTVITDQLLNQIWRENPMRQLAHLTLDHCHGVSPSIVHQVLDADNQLNMVRIWSCRQITRADNAQFAKRISQENMNVYFEWFALNE